MVINSEAAKLENTDHRVREQQREVMQAWKNP